MSSFDEWWGEVPESRAAETPVETYCLRDLSAVDHSIAKQIARDAYKAGQKNGRSAALDDLADLPDEWSSELYYVSHCGPVFAKELRDRIKQLRAE